eukprot:870695-Amphidinium_carterae.2
MSFSASWSPPREYTKGGMAMLLQSVQTVNQMQHRRQSTSCLANDTPRAWLYTCQLAKKGVRFLANMAVPACSV